MPLTTLRFSVYRSEQQLVLGFPLASMGSSQLCGFVPSWWLLIFNKTVRQNKMNHSDSEMQGTSSSPVQMCDESKETQIYHKFHYQNSVVISDRL